MLFDRRNLAAIMMIGAAILAAAPAFAGAPDFVGVWENRNEDSSGVARVIVTLSGPSHVQIRLFGRCPAGTCDWGFANGHNHSDDPDSSEVRSIAVDFPTAGALRRLTLRQGLHGSLRFELVTDYIKHGDQNDFITSGVLLLKAEEKPTAPPVAAAAPQGPPSPPIVPAAASAAEAPAAPPATLAARVENERCAPFILGDGYVAPPDSAKLNGWQLRHSHRTMLDFGEDGISAKQSLIVVKYYHFDEMCTVSREWVPGNRTAFRYWRSEGEIPRQPMKGLVCVDVQASKLKAALQDGDWSVTDGTRTLLRYGENKDDAEIAIAAIRTYHLKGMCTLPDDKKKIMQYWLAE
jgi:hypothetical protein